MKTPAFLAVSNSILRKSFLARARKLAGLE
jgi:hypothetical protein